MNRRPIPMLAATLYGRVVNGQRQRYTRLGYVTTTEPKTHTVRYETASAYTLVEVPAGRYEVVRCETGYPWVLVKYVGTITDDHYVNRLGSASSIAPKRGIGTERTCYAQMDTYSAARRFATDPDWTLCDDLMVTMTQTARYTDPRSRVPRAQKFFKFAPAI
jgi:hypothetical protein